MTEQDAQESPMAGYRASKTFAEKAAWDFVEKEKPNFTLSTINPPMVFGPVVSEVVILQGGCCLIEYSDSQRGLTG